MGDEQGGKRIVPEYYHQAVALSWVSGKITLVLGGEVVGPGEGELTAAAASGKTAAPLGHESRFDRGRCPVLLSALFPNRLRRGPGGPGPQFRKDRDG